MGQWSSLPCLRSPFLTSVQREIEVYNTSKQETIRDKADVVISARGALNDLAWPKIDSLHSFYGKIVHSADWDTR